MMKIQLTRKDFLRLGAGAATLVIVLSGCDEEDSDGQADGAGTGEGGDCTGDGTAQIASTHGHGLTVPHADIEAGEGKDYDITGSAAHSHSIMLTANHMADLAAGMSVTVVSTSGGGHTHQVTITC